MSYSTLMVHMEVGSANDAVLGVTASLAKRFDAHVIGIAASQPMPMMYSDGYVSGDMITENIAEIAKETTEAEASFRAALQGKIAHVEWRSLNASVSLADYVAQEVRAADLLITGPDEGWSALDASRRVIISEVVLQAGRPVLIVPPGTQDLALDRIVVAWKDTREARRAIVDALPLLKSASQVVVVEIAAESDIASARARLDDIAAWLRRQGVTPQVETIVSVGDDAVHLGTIVHEKGADLMVAGAYGHNRLREWVLGGVTRDLLVHARHCSLLSH